MQVTLPSRIFWVHVYTYTRTRIHNISYAYTYIYIIHLYTCVCIRRFSSCSALRALLCEQTGAQDILTNAKQAAAKSLGKKERKKKAYVFIYVYMFICVCLFSYIYKHIYIYVYRALICNSAWDRLSPEWIDTHSFLIRAGIRNVRASVRQGVRNE